MDDETLVKMLKVRFSITDNYHNDLLLQYANDVKYYLRSVGISEEKINSDEAIGCIFRGVSDLWNNEPGQGEFSNFFIQRAIQLRLDELKGNV